MVLYLAIVYETYYLWIIFLTLLILPFFMFGMLCYIYGHVRVEIISTAHVVSKEENIPITLQITNPTIFPIPYLRIFATFQNSYSSNEIARVISASADAKGTSTLVLNLSSSYAGNVLIKLKGYRIYDYIKLFSIRRKLGDSLKVAVLPRYYELETAAVHNHISVESDNHSPNRSGDDPSEVYGIREYREGDRPQRIHWKLSTKVGRLMIKEFSDPINCLDVLFINLCLPDEANMLFYIDSILECALSISYTFLLRKKPHYIAWYDAENTICRRVKVENEKDFYDAVDGLLNIKAYYAEIDTLTAYSAEYPNEQYTSFSYITGKIIMTQLDELTYVKALDKNMILLGELISEDEPGEDIFKKAADMGIDFISVDISNAKLDLEFLF